MPLRLVLTLCAATAAAAVEDAVSMMHVANLASKDVIADKWASTAPDASSLLCAAPSRVGHVTKNPNIRQSPFVIPPGVVIQETKEFGMPIYAGCQVCPGTYAITGRGTALVCNP